MSDLTLILNYDIDYPGTHNPTGRARIRLVPTAEHDASNPHMPTPVESGVPAQCGPVYNNRITYVYRVSDAVAARAVLRATERRLLLRSGALQLPSPRIEF